MRRFRFSMDRVLKLRRQQQRWAELQLSRHSAAVAAARQKLDTLHEKLDRLGDSLEAEVRGAAPVAFEIDLFSYQRRLHAQMASARLLLDEKKREYEKMRAEHVAFKQRVEMLETLRADRHREHRQEQLKQEQQQLDALLAARWTEHQHIEEGKSDG